MLDSYLNQGHPKEMVLVNLIFLKKAVMIRESMKTGLTMSLSIMLLSIDTLKVLNPKKGFKWALFWNLEHNLYILC